MKERVNHVHISDIPKIAEIKTLDKELQKSLTFLSVSRYKNQYLAYLYNVY